ncbi:hypothetical protein E5343_07085 [Rodentibacter caecimuris]|uniref:hypothetical protein n=1 Tax=Rodentibacter caecimuris TaxID=1796644 RepID=UPI0010943465|nr:hypothetical protein [Pasteurella caecimuris]TGY49355.1 hypothetical protein E5343_07085 [Pasteurella caecimuris]
MRKIIKSILKFFICVIIIMTFIFCMLFSLLPPDYKEYEYENASEFLNSEQFSWYVDEMLDKGRSIYLKSFVETSGLIIIFQIDKNDELPENRFRYVTSTTDSKKRLTRLNISQDKIEPFIKRGKEFCFIASDGRNYLVSKYYKQNKANYLITNLRKEKKLEICQ